MCNVLRKIRHNHKLQLLLVIVLLITFRQSQIILLLLSELAPSRCRKLSFKYCTGTPEQLSPRFALNMGVWVGAGGLSNQRRRIANLYIS